MPNNKLVTPHSDREHNELQVTDTNDVLHVTHKRPSGQINLIGTYMVVCLGGLAAYGGFVMPATPLALLNEEIGEIPTVERKRFNTH